MPTVNDSTTYLERGWIMRVRHPGVRPPRRVYLFIHGWTGDERSMEVFARGLPSDSLVLFPRGPILAAQGGYGWTRSGSEGQTFLEDLAQPARDLLAEVDQQMKDHAAAEMPISLVGFSQGAAMAYAITLLFPRRIARLAALAGFLPILPAGKPLPRLEALPVYIAHGRKDETIPVERAHDAARLLASLGADVNFCENEAGHKLPAACFAELTRFLSP